jgi:hypothetical protein
MPYSRYMTSLQQLLRLLKTSLEARTSMLEGGLALVTAEEELVILQHHLRE